MNRNQSIRGGMGVWSFNPNLWMKNEEEAAAYEKAQMDQKVLEAEAQAKIDLIKAQANKDTKLLDPGLIDTFKKTVDSGATTLTTGYRVMLWGGAGLLLYFAYREFVKPAGTDRSLARQAYKDLSESKKDILKIAAKVA